MAAAICDLYRVRLAAGNVPGDMTSHRKRGGRRKSHVAHYILAYLYEVFTKVSILAYWAPGIYMGA